VTIEAHTVAIDPHLDALDTTGLISLQVSTAMQECTISLARYMEIRNIENNLMDAYNKLGA
jgi:hypothetical protein